MVPNAQPSNNNIALGQFVRDVIDFPKPGILFRDITPLLGDACAMSSAIEQLLAPWRETEIDRIAAVEARGFLFAAPMAIALGVGLIPIRKPGKLPFVTISHEYALEYGTDRLEMHADSLTAGQRVLLVDDVLATGGTAGACATLVERSGAKVVGCAFLLEIKALGGRERLSPHRIESVLVY
jgi:adenine phosphoribosyltransferase